MTSSSYEQFVLNQPAGTIFQSSAFGEFQETLSYRGKYWACHVANGEGEASALVVRMKLPLGHSWLWVPYGPAGGFNEELFGDIEKIAHDERAIFTRVEPGAGWTSEDTLKVRELFGEKRIAHATPRFTAEHSLVLDLDEDEGGLLAQMKPKGRYNIGLAEKKGVTVKIFAHLEDIPPHDFNLFYEILKRTSARDGFGIHPRYFYENLLRILGEKGMAALALGYGPDGAVVAGIIVTFYKDTATYYFGASDHAARALMAPYLIQWEAIREAKKRGFSHYDFLGIAPPNEPTHPWAGITEFKKKFGGREIAYSPAFDIVHSPFKYKALAVARKLRG